MQFTGILNETQADPKTSTPAGQLAHSHANAKVAPSIVFVCSLKRHMLFLDLTVHSDGQRSIET